jgi:hypothetical protein
MIAGIRETGSKFHEWIRQQLADGQPIEQNIQVAERVKRAAIHFSAELGQIIGHLQNCSISTDNRGNAKEVNDRLKEFFGALALRQHLFSGFSVAMDLDDWHQKKRSFQVPSFGINVYGGDNGSKKELSHPALYWQLKQLRDAISSRKELPLYLVASSKTIEELVTYLPHTEDELERINGFGKVKVKNYGGEFLELIRNYCEEQGLVSNMPVAESKVTKKKRAKEGELTPAGDTIGKKGAKPVSQKVDTRAESYRLYREGMSIRDIAAERGFVLQTIEGHLAHYIETGDLTIEGLVSPDKIELIADAVARLESVSIGGVKGLLGDAVSFGDVRFFLAWRNSQNKEG